MANFEEKTEIENLISDIEDLINGAAPVPFGNGRVLVDKERINGLAREAKAKIPEDIKKSRKLLEQKDKILVSAGEEAKDIIQKAKIEADKLTSQDAITYQAQQRAIQALEKANQIAQNKITAANEEARGIVEKARMDARKINADTTKYINDIVENVDKIIATSITGLSSSLKDLRESKKV